MNSIKPSSRQKIDTIRNTKGEALFRMALYHLLDVGYRNMTPENVKGAINDIRVNRDDTNSLMTNDFMIEILEIASDLATVDTTDLLIYVKKYITFS